MLIDEHGLLLLIRTYEQLLYGTVEMQKVMQIVETIINDEIITDLIGQQLQHLLHN